MSDDLVTIEKYQFLPEAQAVRMHIESEGIEAFLADAETVSTDWALGNAVGYIKLQVRESQTENAQVILDKIRAMREARGDGNSADFEFGSCLACGTRLQPDQTHCTECGWSYADQDDDDAAESLPLRVAGNNTNSGSSPTEPESVLDALRSIKKLVMLFFLAPLFAAMIFLAHSLLAWFVQRLVEP